MKIIARSLMSVAVLTAFAGGCSSVPKVAMPDGQSRIQVNSNPEAHDYETRAAEEKAQRSYQNAVLQQVQAMNNQIAELRIYIKQLELSKQQAQIPATPGPIVAAPTDTTIQIKAMPPAPEKTEVKATPTTSSVKEQEPVDLKVAKDLSVSEANGAVEVHPNAVIFRVHHGYAKTEFMPTEKIKSQILSAAQEGKSIEVRGRTDSLYVNEADRKIAIQRANNARRFLIKNGVASDKIRMTFRSAGGFVADNSTPEGRAQNRRVELEMKGLNTAAYKNTEIATTTVASK